MTSDPMELPFEEYMAWLAAHIKERDQGVLTMATEKSGLRKRTKPARPTVPTTVAGRWTGAVALWRETGWVRLPRIAYGPGVYVIYADAQLVYIGMSDYMADRVRAHLSNRCETLQKALGRSVGEWSVKYRPERFYGERATLELRLIKWLRPVLNRNGSGRKRGDSELPPVNMNQYRLVRKEA